MHYCTGNPTTITTYHDRGPQREATAQGPLLRVAGATADGARLVGGGALATGGLALDACTCAQKYVEIG